MVATLYKNKRLTNDGEKVGVGLLLNITKKAGLAESALTIRHQIEQEISQEYWDWAELLCKMGDIESFVYILQCSKSELLAIMKYRRILMREGKSKVSFIELDRAYSSKQYTRVHNLLEILFLEVVTKEWFEFIMDKIGNIEDGLMKLYDRHMEDNNLRILSVLQTL